MYIHICTYMFMCKYICIYIYMYLYVFVFYKLRPQELPLDFDVRGVMPCVVYEESSCCH